MAVTRHAQPYGRADGDPQPSRAGRQRNCASRQVALPDLQRGAAVPQLPRDARTGLLEPPELLDDYVELWQSDTGPPGDIGCRRCGRAVVNLGDRWSHINAEGGLNVGCRAASFTASQGWGRDHPTKLEGGAEHVGEETTHESHRSRRDPHAATGAP